jgi:hypothetical protein
MRSEVPDASGFTARANPGGAGVPSFGARHETTGLPTGIVARSRPIAWAREAGDGCRFPPPPPPRLGPDFGKKIMRGSCSGSRAWAAAGLGADSGPGLINTTVTATAATAAA